MPMIGAIAGDIIGSIYEWDEVENKDFIIFDDFSIFTDDSVLTFAIADSIINDIPYKKTIHKYGNDYPQRGYGGRFLNWLTLDFDDAKPYDSFGNGSGMRVSPIGFAFKNINDVLEVAKQSALPTHNHPEGIKGAQAIAASVFWANNGHSKEEIKKNVIEKFGYDLNRSIDQIKTTYKFDVTCQGSVPEAIIAFLESTDYEDSIRLAISLNGDSDTIACMTGGIAQAFYKKIPQFIHDKTRESLPPEFITLLDKFEEKYVIKYDLI